MFRDRFNHLADTIKDLGICCEHREVELTTRISTLEVTVGQQTIQLQKAQEVVEDNVQTILRLQEELETSDLEIKNLQLDVIQLEEVVEPNVREIMGGIKASGRGMVEYPFNPEGEKEPYPYPYTHPIRDIPDYSRVKVK